MDNDVKIYKPKSELTAQPELASILQTVNTQRANGNMEKARQLGRLFATLTPSAESDKLSIDFSERIGREFLTRENLIQIKVLMVFSAEAAMQIYLPELLANTASNALYDYLRKHDNEFYKIISDSTAFTFYYLAIKKGGDLARYVGEAFAMLCGAEKNEAFIQAGKTAYEVSMQQILNEIEDARFVDVNI